MRLTQTQDAAQSIKARQSLHTQALLLGDNLYGAARSLTRNASDAEDLVQDTYVKAFRFADRFQSGTNLKAWLRTILVNTHRNACRRAARDPVSVDSSVITRTAVPSDPKDGPEQRLMSAVRTTDLRAALDLLPAPFRHAVWLRDAEECSYAEIAQMEDVPLGTVMSRISRGRHLLVERLTNGAVPTGHRLPSRVGAHDRRHDSAHAGKKRMKTHTHTRRPDGDRGQLVHFQRRLT